jgi:hypothetical protein
LIHIGTAKKSRSSGSGANIIDEAKRSGGSTSDGNFHGKNFKPDRQDFFYPEPAIYSG